MSLKSFCSFFSKILSDHLYTEVNCLYHFFFRLPQDDGIYLLRRTKDHVSNAVLKSTHVQFLFEAINIQCSLCECATCLFAFFHHASVY